MGDPGPVRAPSGLDTLEPATPRLLLPVSLSTLTDPQEGRLAPAGRLARHQAQPSRQLAPILERGGIPNSSHECRRGQWPNALYLSQPLAGFVVLKHPLDLVLSLLKPVVQGP
jgi:hypothetical protein